MEPHTCIYVAQNQCRCINPAPCISQPPLLNNYQTRYCIRHLCIICKKSKHSHQIICNDCSADYVKHILSLNPVYIEKK